MLEVEDYANTQTCDPQVIQYQSTFMIGDAVDYLRNLAKSPLFSVDAKRPERFIKSNSVPTDTEWAFPFELQLTLRKPVKMP